MARLGLDRAFGLATLVAALSGCGVADAIRPGADAGFQLRFEDVLDPAAFQREGAALPDAADGAAGFWAVVPDLPRPERARVENLATGAAATVALYDGSAGASIRLSGAAAEALGLGAEGGRVRVTAMRRQPRIASP